MAQANALHAQVMEADVFQLPSEYPCQDAACSTPAHREYYLTFEWMGQEQMLLLYTDELPAKVAALRQLFCPVDAAAKAAF